MAVAKEAQPARGQKGVHRLLDMVVREISLVDRAANQWRFLVVKRSDEMAVRKNDAVDGAVAGALHASEDDDAGAGAGQGGDGGDGESSDPLEVAVTALESLTEVVELLGGTPGEDTEDKLSELSGDIEAATRSLLAALGGEEPVSSVGNTLGNAAGVAEDDKRSVGATIESARALLGRVRSTLEGATASAATPSGQSPESSAALTEVKTTLTGISESLASITESIKDQQARLSKVEKHQGLPNSSRAGEQARAATPDEADEAWPMDLNEPMDRDSVDQTVSFHDL